MSTINFTGFETGDSSELKTLSGTASIQGTTVRSGSYALRCNPTTTATGFATIAGLGASGAAANASVATSFIRFYFKYDTKPDSADEEIVSFVAPGAKMSVRLNSAGNPVAYDTTLTLLATGATALSSGTWYMLEVKCSTGNPSAWEVKINGTSEINGTANLGTSNAVNVILGKNVNRNGKTVDFFYDDFLWSNSAYPGAGQCAVLVPNGAGNYQGWSIGAGSGSNYQVVDEVPPNSDTDYLVSPIIGSAAETEALTSTATAGVGGTINSAKAVAIVKQNLSGGTVRVRLRSGSTDTDTGADFTATASYVLIAKLFDTDPATSAAWTTGGLDAAETGAVSETSTAIRMTFTALMVDYYVPPSTGSSAGTSTVTATSKATKKSPGSATGTGTATATSKATKLSVGAGAGTSTVSGTSRATKSASGTVSGTSVASGISRATKAVSGSAVGTSTVAGVGRSLTVGAGSASGSSTTAIVSEATKVGVGTSAGASTAASSSKATKLSVGASAGTSTATAVGMDLDAGSGSAAGTCTVSGVSKAQKAASGASAGDSVANGVGGALAGTVGVANGTSAAAGVGKSQGRGAAAASGTSSALAAGRSTTTGSGASVGASTTSGVGRSLVKGVASTAGTSTCLGVGSGKDTGTGHAAGTSSALGTGKSTWLAVGQASGTSSAVGVKFNPAPIPAQATEGPLFGLFRRRWAAKEDERSRQEKKDRQQAKERQHAMTNRKHDVDVAVAWWLLGED